MDYKWALPDAMAQAGFYHHPSDSGDDRAMCFTCSVCLVCWEKTDEPWSEHERHSPECPFVKGEYTQNVPFSITYATSPAVATEGYSVMSNGDQGNIICTGNRETGDICVWNVERQLKNCLTFNVRSCEIMRKIDLEEAEILLTSLCTFKKHTVLSKSSCSNKTCTSNDKNREVVGTRIIAGVKLKGEDIKLDDQQSVISTASSENEPKLALIVYAATEKARTAKTNVTTANGNNNNNIMSFVPKESSQLPSISSLQNSILQNSKLDTIEERLEDDFLKIFENETMLMNKPRNEMLNKNKVQSDGKKDGDQKSAVASGGTIVEESDIVCTPFQVIPIVPFLFFDYEISEMFPSFDNKYLLVVLKGLAVKGQHADSDNEEAMETDDNIAASEDGVCNVQLILYAIGESGFINESPVNVRILEEKDTPIELCMLPKLDTSGRLFTGTPAETENGLFVITCADGSLKILSLTTLKTLSEARVEGQKFVSSVYCKNLERLCGITENGTLHFYSFYDLDVDSSDEYEEETYVNEMTASDDVMCVDGSGQQKASTSTANDEYTQFDNATPSTSTNYLEKETEKRHVPEIVAYRKQLTLADLQVLYSLTLFDEMLTPYSAEVPSCWNELVQAQKQRRNPQNMRPGDDTHLTRTWRLHNDA